MPHPNASGTDVLEAAFQPQRSRYVVGIDLGTTNCALAFVDTHRSPYRVEVLSIEQYIDFGTIGKSETLPSFHYELASNERDSIDGRFRFAAEGRGDLHAGVVGALARDRALQVPGRGIASAKSWLCNPMVDRKSELLPWHGEEDVERLSPVEVSRRYLEHLRRCWDRAHPASPLADQDVIVTLPASFDEVARQLTLDAAHRAGLAHVILIEEPQAAFYAWLERHQETWMDQLRPGQSILVCDIGGGTTDFTLIRVIDSAVAASETKDSMSTAGGLEAGAVEAGIPATGAPVSDMSTSVESRLQKSFGLHRVAVGPHLLLGGDNLDLALAHYVEQQLAQASPNSQLTVRQWEVLKAQARRAKEILLGPNPPEQVTISLPGSGSKLIESTKSVAIDRAWARQQLIEGFFGAVGLDAVPDRSEGLFREFGLPYEQEPNVHKHLAQFLWEHRWAGRSETAHTELSEHLAARPDWVLFNGGVLESPEIRNAILNQIAAWFSVEADAGWKPGILEGNRLDLAVAMGAAYFGLVRRGEGIRIDARLARSYYLQVQQSPPKAVCVMPASASPLDRFRLESHPFALMVGEPVQFPLFFSSTQLTHTFGEFVDIDLQQMTALPPIQTVLELGNRKTRRSIPVLLESELTEIGTLSMRVVTDPQRDESVPESRWQLEFDVRGNTDDMRRVTANQAPGEIVDHARIAQCLDVLEATFGVTPTLPLKDVFQNLSSAIGSHRSAWPPSLLRAMWKHLLEIQDCRKRSPDAESRWLNLIGWCLRPGFGFPADDWRVQQTWRAVHNKLMHRSAASASESVILWRRIAGGFTTGQQRALFQDAWTRVRPALLGGAAGVAINTNVAMELLRLLGSLERLAPAEKEVLVNAAFTAFTKKRQAPLRPALLWMIGRLGSRTPVYATLQQTVSPGQAANWANQLLAMQSEFAQDTHAALSLALMQMTRRTGDRYRDVDEGVRRRVLDGLDRLEAPDLHKALVAEVGVLDDENTANVVGDSLPLGFMLRN